MTKRQSFSEEELHAFIDGELDQTRSSVIAEMIEDDPALAEKVAAYRADKDQVANLFSGLDKHPLPQAWLDRIKEVGTDRLYHNEAGPFNVPTARTRRFYLHAAMALAASILILIGGTFAYRQIHPAEDAIIAEAQAARQETLPPGVSFGPSALASAERRNAMVSEALDMPVKVPELAKFGYQIAGIRVYAHMNGGNAVELEYRDERNRLFTMYMRRPSGPASVDMTERNGMWTCIWQDDVLGTVMQGEMSAAEMARLASAAYNGLYL